MPTTNIIGKFAQLDDRSLKEIDRIRRFRNNLVHGVEVPSPADIASSADVLESIVAELRRKQL